MRIVKENKKGGSNKSLLTFGVKYLHRLSIEKIRFMFKCLLEFSESLSLIVQPLAYLVCDLVLPMCLEGIQKQDEGEILIVRLIFIIFKLVFDAAGIDHNTQ